MHRLIAPRGRKSALPHAQLRAAIFWVLFASWPIIRVIHHVWNPEWLEDAADILAALTALAFLLGRFLFQDTQRQVCERVARVEAKVEGYDEAWDLLAPFDGLTGHGPSRSSR